MNSLNEFSGKDTSGGEADDYGVTGGERRKLPYGSSGGNMLLTKRSYERVKRERAEEGLDTPAWDTLKVYTESTQETIDRMFEELGADSPPANRRGPIAPPPDKPEPDPANGSNFDVIEYTLPEPWASYLINFDASGLEPGEQEQIDAFLAKEGNPNIVDCDEEGYFSRYCDCPGCLAGNMLTYKALVPKDKNYPGETEETPPFRGESEDRAPGDHGYVAFYKGKRMDVYAPSSYAAQKKAAAAFRAKKSYEVNVVLAEKPDGTQVTHVPEGTQRKLSVADQHQLDESEMSLAREREKSGNKAWFRNHYKCPCGCEWDDEWDCTCDDRCPKCDTSCSPTESEDIGESTQKKLSVADQHQLRIARETLKMNDTMSKVMGGPSKEEAREIIARLTGQAPSSHHPSVRNTIPEAGTAAGMKAGPEDGEHQDSTGHYPTDKKDEQEEEGTAREQGYEGDGSPQEDGANGSQAHTDKGIEDMQFQPTDPKFLGPEPGKHGYRAGWDNEIAYYLSHQQMDKLEELKATPEQMKAFVNVVRRWHKVSEPNTLMGDPSCIMVQVWGEPSGDNMEGYSMWLGIEKDGYTHS